MLRVILVFLLMLSPIKVDAFDLSAQSAVLIEQSTGSVLYEKNANNKMKPASTTKILTAICAVENGILDEMVTVSRNASHTEGSSMYLKEGEKIALKDLVYGLMLNSGNDAAIAIAEHIGGNMNQFANMMNNKAKDIGAHNSHFVNPNGLDHEDHYTTAYDLAMITAYALNNPVFADIVKTKSKVVSTADGVNKYLTNHNKLLNMYNGCVGVKTGFTKASGRTLVTAAKREDLQLVAVTMNAPNDWNDHKNMLDYGFENYEIKKIIRENEIMGNAEVINGLCETVNFYSKVNYSALDKKGESKSYELKVSSKKTKAPIKKDEIIGNAIVYKDGAIVFQANLYAWDQVEKVKSKIKFIDIFKRLMEL